MKSNPVIRVLGSLKLTLILLGVFAVATALATFLEVRFGTEGARALVYNARWFEVLLALIVLNLLVSLITKFPYRAHQVGFVISHIAFIIVLVGAGITRYFGYEGTMPIREGTSTDFLYSTKDYVQLSTNGEGVSFPVRLWKPGKIGVSRRVEAGGGEFNVRVDEYWPHLERRMMEAPGGEPVIVYSGAGMGSRTSAMGVGERAEVGGVVVHFVAEDTGDIGAGSVNGELLVTIDGEVHRLDVPSIPPAEISAGGYRFRIRSRQPDSSSFPTPSGCRPARDRSG